MDRDALAAWLPPRGMTATFERFDPTPGGSYRLVLTYVDSQDAPGKTDADGKFELKNVPPGNYTLVAWHELYGRQQQRLTVVDETKPVEATFRYKAP